jgi:hypothetical protein
MEKHLMKTRDEMIREHYIKIDKIMSSRPRAQTGPKASFMGEMNKPNKKEKHENKRTN